MKHLSILRHAKAERPDGYDIDAARPLTKRGFKDAAMVGKVLRQSQPTIDWIVSSPAQRTRQTTETLALELATSPKVVWHDSVYAATITALLDALRQVPTSADHVLLVGHNPGMEDLTSSLCTGSPERLQLNLATGSLASIRLEIHTWSQIRPGSGTLLALLRPSLIR